MRGVVAVSYVGIDVDDLAVPLVLEQQARLVLRDHLGHHHKDKARKEKEQGIKRPYRGAERRGESQTTHPHEKVPSYPGIISI